MIDRPDRQREPLPTSVADLPELPTAYRRALDAGLAALDLDLRPGARAAIDDHVRLLLAWTPAINLTSLRDPAEIATRHVVDSLAGLRFVRGAERFVDLGSGGGYPGLPLVAASGASATLVESIGKKARFLATVAAAVGVTNRVTVVAERAEAVARRAAERERWPLVTTRAVGALPELVELAFPLLRVGGRLIAWKRADIEAEVRDARRLLPLLGGGSIELVPARLAALPGHLFVIVEKLGPTPAAFPRDPGMRARRPS